MQYVYDDGGRADAGFKGDAGDCVTRAIAIATEQTYEKVYGDMWASIDAYLEAHNRGRVYKRLAAGGGRKGTTPRHGMFKSVYGPYLESIGWSWVSTMKIGEGCKTHLKADELPMGRLIVQVSKHIVAVINGVIHDTSDPSRAGTRCVYGYHIKK